MISFDTNIVIYSLHKGLPRHQKAYQFLDGLADSKGVVVSEQMLLEVYLLIRNEAVFPKPYSAAEAVSICRAFRENPNWQLVECESVMENVWKHAADSDFPRRRIIDYRLAFTLLRAGVTEFATSNVKDFEGLGFDRVWDPTQD
jgi:toxin-antitoxin system PIN domain toxin